MSTILWSICFSHLYLYLQWTRDAYIYGELLWQFLYDGRIYTTNLKHEQAAAVFCIVHHVDTRRGTSALKNKRQMAKMSNLDNLQAHHFNLDSFKNKYDPGIDDLSEMLMLSLYQLLWIFLLWNRRSSRWNTWRHEYQTNYLESYRTSGANLGNVTTLIKPRGVVSCSKPLVLKIPRRPSHLRPCAAPTVFSK